MFGDRLITLSNTLPWEIHDVLLIVGATTRLTRVIVADDIGEWFIKVPLTAWLGQESALSGNAHQYGRYLSGLDCPHCVGYWIGAGVLASYVLCRRSSITLALWRFIASTLVLNVVVVIAGREVDYWSK